MSALVLRIIACLTMLADHIGFRFSGRLPWLICLRYVGRLSFPLFVFLLVNGYRHTSSPLGYSLRLGIFALISQIPFDLFCGHRLFFVKWNVYLTLLLCLLTIWAVDALRRRVPWKPLCLLPAAVPIVLCSTGIISCDYGAKGIVMALAFYFWEGKPLPMAAGLLAGIFWGRIWEAGANLLKMLLGQPVSFVPLDSWELVQLFSLLSLGLMLLYNGKLGKGPSRPLGKKAIQLAFYLFYPVHLVFLWILA